jgi:hypothetical protein
VNQWSDGLTHKQTSIANGWTSMEVPQKTISQLASDSSHRTHDLNQAACQESKLPGKESAPHPLSYNISRDQPHFLIDDFL